MLNPLVLPETIGDIQSNTQLLWYAKDFGLAAERMRDLLYFFFLFFVFGFLGALYQVTKVVSSYREKGDFESPED